MTEANPARRALLLAGILFLLPAVASGEQTAAAPRSDRGGTLAYKDLRLGGKLPARDWQIFVARENNAGKDYGPNTDPKFNVHYPGKLQVVCSSEEDPPRSERVFVVHFMRPEDELLARRVASVMGRLYWLGQDYLGVGPAPGRYVNVWLARHGEPGAEEHQKNIYLFAVDQHRHPAEWVRELAHEYSHIFLPPVGEYTAPEKWANGYLGERLFLKWMLADNGMADAWSEPIDGAAYVAKEVAPLRSRYLNAGPGSPRINRNDAEGMDHWIGQILAIEAAHGPRVLRELLRNYQTRRPQGTGTYLGRALQDLTPAQFSIHPALFVPDQSQAEMPAGLDAAVRVRKAGYWFYLPGGSWQFTLSGVIPAGATAKLETMELRKVSGTGALAVWECTMPGAVGSWQRLEIAAPEGQTLDLTGIAVSRKG